MSHFFLRFLQKLDDQLDDSNSLIWNVDFDINSIPAVPDEPPPPKPPTPPLPSSTPPTVQDKLDALTINTETIIEQSG